MNNALGRFRWIALAEGVSFLILLFIAMPLKYWGGMPLAVKYTGWAHGVLFIAFIVSLIEITIAHRWSLVKSGIAFVASLVPFGTFVLDAKVLKQEENQG